MKKKKILFLANADIGLYKFRKELLEKLVGDGHEVFISVPSGEFIDDLKNIGCHHIETQLSRHGLNPFQDFKLILEYKRILRTINPDIVFSYTIKPNIYGGIATASYGIDFVPNITGLGSAVENNGLLQKFIILLYLYSFRKVKTVFFQNTENEKFFLKNKIALGKHKILPGSGVNLDYYKPLKISKRDTIDFLFVSRIMKEKGIDQYLDAANVIRKKYPNTRFHICGFCEDNYEDLINDLDKKNVIIYHGLVKNMVDVYKNVDCVVHPTYYPEGLSNVLLEASASARPIITTNRSGCREVIEDEYNGFVVEEKNSTDLINKIEKFLSLSFKEREQLGINGRKKVEKEFDRSIVINSYINEIDG